MKLSRREVLQGASLASASTMLTPSLLAQQPTAASGAPTNFQIACMTLPYSAFPLDRALEGIAKAGYKHVAWGVTHQNAPGRKEPVMAKDAPPQAARELAKKSRDLGLNSVMLFSEVYVGAEDSVKVHTRRVEQAAAAGIPFVLTFGAITAGGREVWIKNLKELGPIARANKVTILVKQHGGNTATGVDCMRIVNDVADEGVKVGYDAGNVLDYKNDDPLPDIRQCWPEVRAFCIKDHRNTPKDEDCGPGLGEIDHYKLLAPVTHTGLTMPLCCENISEPLVGRYQKPEELDVMARRAREFLETVTRGLLSVPNTIKG
jgi:sugar phosphate isomerase/epimerase